MTSGDLSLRLRDRVSYFAWEDTFWHVLGWVLDGHFPRMAGISVMYIDSAR